MTDTTGAESVDGDLERWAGFHASLAGLMDLAVAHRSSCLANGYTPETAERMSIDMHAALLQMMVLQRQHDLALALAHGT